jgi:GNAT superfamily N-acetyltransferase
MRLEEFKGLQIRPIQKSALADYFDLLSMSFQRFNPTLPYLNWLYFENPRGSVCGYDAYDGDLLVAHYACIPIKIEGYQFNSLLSLNTATHPDYQGRGLFKELASRTFEAALPTYANVVGVANAKSVGGFVKYLNFQMLGNLELRIGQLSRQFVGSRIFTPEELLWRSTSPGRPMKVFPLESGLNLLSVKPFRFFPRLDAVVFEEDSGLDDYQSHQIGITLDWRKGVNPLLKLPEKIKPSPLVLIFKPLLEPDSTLLTSFSFPDFDAF